jgi:hypothetical protein
MSQQLVQTGLTVTGHTSVQAFAQGTYNYSQGGATPAMIVPGTINATTSHIDFYVFDNNTTSDRTCFIHLFGNFNTSQVPDATIEVLQTENDIVDVKVTNVDISNQNYSGPYFETLDATTATNNGGSIPNTGATGYGAVFTTNISDPFSNLNGGTTANGDQLFVVDYLDEFQNLQTTDDLPATISSSDWLTFSSPSVNNSTNQETLYWNADVNPQGASKRFARIRFRHPVDTGFEDTVLIEQDRGYDPNLDTVAIRCEEPTGWAGTNTNPTGNPQTEISPGTPTVGTLSGSFTAQTSGLITSTGDTFVIDHNNQSLVVEYDVEKDNSNFLVEPFVTLDSFEHDYNYGYSPQNPSLSDFADEAQGLTEPIATQSNYNYFNVININANNSIADRRFRIKAHHPHNTNYPGGYDDYMYVLQKPQPIAWFPQNEDPASLTGYVNNVGYTPTATQNYLSGNTLQYIDANTGGFGYEIIHFSGSSIQGVSVRSTGSKAPLILPIKYGEYNDAWTDAGPGFAVTGGAVNQNVFPGSQSTNYSTFGYSWQGIGYPTPDDITNWPLGVFPGHSGVYPIGYDPHVLYFDSTTNTHVDYDSYLNLPQQLNVDHQCSLKLVVNNPVYKDRYFAFGVWHSDKVDYDSGTVSVSSGGAGQVLTYAPKAAFATLPDDILWVKANGSYGASLGITVSIAAGGSGGVGSNSQIVATGGTTTIPATITNSSPNYTTILDDDGVLHNAYHVQFQVSGADFRVKFRAAYVASGAAFLETDYSLGSFGGSGLQPSTNIDGVSSDMTGAPFGTAAVQATAIGSQSNTFENQFGVNPEHWVSYDPQTNVNATPMDAAIENQVASGQLGSAFLNIRIPQNFTGQRRSLQVIFESEWDDEHKVEFFINQDP